MSYRNTYYILLFIVLILAVSGYYLFYKLISSSPQTIPTNDHLAIYYEENQGQTDPSVRFISRHAGQLSYFTPDGATFAVRQGDPLIKLLFEGANAKVKITGSEKLPGKSNYFFGNKPEGWFTSVPHYKKIKYQELYRGIDLVFKSNQKQLEYDLIISPGVSPDIISFTLSGAEKLDIDSHGDLIVNSGNKQLLKMRKPFIYQTIKGKKHQITGHYVVNRSNQIKIHIDAYDQSKQLIIDPVILFSTYLGGNDSDQGNKIVADALGNSYITGNTRSPIDFPTSLPIQATNAGGDDAFVTKIDPNGTTLLFSTYYGGSDRDTGTDIDIDSAGNILVTGFTRSTDFPTVNPIQATLAGGNDAFVFKLDQTGSTILHSTYHMIRSDRAA